MEQFFVSCQFLLRSRSETWPFLSNPLDTYTPQRENIYVISGDGLSIRRCERDTSPAVKTVVLYPTYFLPWCSISNFNYSYFCVLDFNINCSLSRVAYLKDNRGSREKDGSSVLQACCCMLSVFLNSAYLLMAGLTLEEMLRLS